MRVHPVFLTTTLPQFAPVPRVTATQQNVTLSKISPPPTVAEIIAIAVAAGEFHDRLRSTHPQIAAAQACAIAVDTWCHDHARPLSVVTLPMWEGIMRGLMAEAEAHQTRLDAEEAAEAEALAEAIEAGDVDAEGNWIPYTKSYFGSVA